MPIYEYACRDCGEHFEAIVQRSTVPQCPGCKSEALEKQMSVFAVGGGAKDSFAAPPPGACGTCGDPRGPGACSMN
jgi:putative FmdB family regulatory protein